MAPKLLDLFCGAGGAGMGYHRAGFEVTGVDTAPQPHYPFDFIQADALDYLVAHGHEYDVIHASPPCQRYSSVTPEMERSNHPDLIGATRHLLQVTGRPYIIENVPGAVRWLQAPVMLCGKSFGLKVYRHRYFECSILLLAPPHEMHRDQTPSVGHAPHISPNGFISVVGNIARLEYAKQAMGIDWMDRSQLVQAIPPAYTEYIGRQLLEAVCTP